MNFVLDLAISVFSIAVVVQYAVSLRTHFASEKMPTGTVVISLVVTATSLLYLLLLWFGEQHTVPQIVGLLIEVAGMALFWWAIRASRAARLKMAFDKENPHGLVTGGPYAYLRHPFYTSYLIFWAGWAITTWSPWAILPLPIILTIYVMAALGEERKFSNTPMAEDYAAYRQRSGFFWPKLTGRVS
ncbi:methyltransferase family protein [Devosia sp.]|uniref:methyltransferase family protein n=1 Tax=Devosia sp. TaxID=1871048 RepID=UPI003A8EC62F